MRRLLLLVTAMMVVCVTEAQDVIVLNNADEIQAKITAITQNEVSYKRWSNLEGPTYTISKHDIFCIKYPNGEKDVINTSDGEGCSLYAPIKRSSRLELTPATFQGYVSCGAIFMSGAGGPALDVSVGARIYEHLYVGVETGFHTLIFDAIFYDYESFYDVNIATTHVPIGVNLKGFVTRDMIVNPYIHCTLGGVVGVGGMRDINGFYCQVGAGVEFKRFIFSIGYNAHVYKSVYLDNIRTDLGYVQLGYRFGK